MIIATLLLSTLLYKAIELFGNVPILPEDTRSFYEDKLILPCLYSVLLVHNRLMTIDKNCEFPYHITYLMLYYDR
jgi:hypothetical protein